MNKLLSILLTVLVILTNTLNSQETLKIEQLKCEYKTNPLGIQTQKPSFSWQLKSIRRNILQNAYRIIVSDTKTAIEQNTGNIWDSKKVVSDNSIMVLYSGSKLQPAKTYFWKVMVWDNTGKSAAWSDMASFGTGLFNPEDWNGAKWIGVQDLPEEMRIVPGEHGNGDNLGHRGLSRPEIPLLRNSFEVKQNLASATLFISGLGQYEAFVNGEKIGNSFLAPGWTHYDKTVLYNTYDITHQLKRGKNTLGAMVGNGFHNVNRERYRKLVIAYGNPKLICKLHLVYSNGETEDIVSNSDWQTAPSPITFTSIYSGEDYDARLEQPTWCTPGFDEGCWQKALEVTPLAGKLTSEIDYPVTLQQAITVKTGARLNQGKYIFDFGQNTAAIVEIKVKGKKGQVVRLVPAELLTKNNEANQTATGRWHYYSYTLKGDGVETWHPAFTYYGFRYVQVEGAAPDTAVDPRNFAQLVDIKMLPNRNASPVNGSFDCSKALFNKIVPLINWAIQSNMQSVLTDCPHREKLGWLEQTFLMGASVNYNFEIYNLYRKIIQDIKDAQTTDGLVPTIAPEYVQFEGAFRDTPEWGSASIILPYLLYKWYGDRQIMEEAWPMMTRFISYLKSKSKNQILSYGLGDWFDMGPQRPGFAQLTPVEVTATAMYYYDVQLLAEMAGLLGKKAEQQQFGAWAGEIKTAYNKRFFNSKTCVYSTGSQTAMAMPLSLGLVENKFREQVVKNLTDSILKGNKALTAGDVGFHYLVDALTSNGQSQLLFDMNNRDDVPGYGYQIKKGATALTESWPALEVVSNNHLMLGHLMEWFYNGIGGIRQAENSVAFKNIVIKPSLVGDLTSAKTTFQSPYGLISTQWEKKETSFVLKVSIPANTTATVFLPVNPGQSVFESNMPVTQSKEIKCLANGDGMNRYGVGSGEYVFEVK